MTIGTAIFSATLLLSLVMLYINTKDRWRWKRIMGVLVAVGAVAMVSLLSIERVTSARRRAAESQLDMERHARARVALGEPYGRVLQRQGVPDTMWSNSQSTFAIGYRDAYARPEKAFVFDAADSILVHIVFLGSDDAGISGIWLARDSVRLGMEMTIVRSRLGEPCDESIDDRETTYLFATEADSVLRFVRVPHGSVRIDAQGWTRGPC